MIASRDLAPERQTRLGEIVQQRGVVRVEELTDLLRVSPATIRRDLETLEEAGQLRRVHGGAISAHGRMTEPLFDDKTSIAANEKRAIADEAARLINTDDTIYLDGGSTVLELAKILRPRSDITVVTNSLRAAVELSTSDVTLILVGGELRKRSQTIVGALTRKILDELHIDIAFMGTIGLTLEEGMTTTAPAEAYTKELIMAHSNRTVLLVDSAKIGNVSFARAGDLNEVDTLITDRVADPAMRKQLKKCTNLIEVE
jgi:DeoR/GlpR family transcriptional regulator of sugar metabolism